MGFGHGLVVQAVKHSCTIYYYLCVLTNLTNTCTYRFDLSQSDPNNRLEHLVQKTFKIIFLRLLSLYGPGPMAPYSCFKKLLETDKISHFLVFFLDIKL